MNYLLYEYTSFQNSSVSRKISKGFSYLCIILSMIGFFFSPIDTVAYAQAHGRRTLRFIGVSAPVAQDIMMVVNSTFTSTMSSGFFIKKGAQLVGQIVLQSKS